MPATKRKFELISIRYENVRGFYDATLPLEKEKILIVGRNHAGKTSALKLLAWLINDADPNRLFNNDSLTQEEQTLLLPSRSARHRARRITLTVRISDGRTARKFECDGNNATLRIGFRVSGVPSAFIQLGQPGRKSGSRSHGKAKELLKRIQENCSVILVPSARDAKSSQFQKRFQNLFKDKLAERVLHPGTPSGATSEHRKLLEAVKKLKELSEFILNPTLNELTQSLPGGLLESPLLGFNEDGIHQALLEWVLNQTNFKLITGDHDNSGVEPADVGAGLQSVLDIAAASVILKESDKSFIVAVEEPEAFLHPSLQRIVARKLLSEKYGHKTLVSTHSPVMVEEAKYESILLAADRKIYRPKQEQDRTRSDIHTALLSGQGAEMIFATSVLLVEGEGDRTFFEGLRRRLAIRDPSGRVENLFVIQVGGSDYFSPWIKLLHALNGGKTKGGLDFLIAPDGDAIKSTIEALGDNNIGISKEVIRKLEDAGNEFKGKNFKKWQSLLSEINGEFSDSTSSVPVCFLNGDLESSIFLHLPSERCENLADSIEVVFENKNAFIKRMGSKAVDGKAGRGNKAPYMRKQIAEEIKFSELSDNIKLVLRRWLSNAGFSDKDAKSLIEKGKK